MSSPDPIYVGVDTTSGQKDCLYAVIDRELNLVEMLDVELEQLTSFLAAQKSARVSINAPSGVNTGVVKAMLTRDNPSRATHFRGVDIRLAEYNLRQVGVHISGTPSREESCPGWMQAGFGLYREVAKLGYQAYPTEGADLQWIETHPHACFCVLLEQAPFPQPTLEGRLQRQLVLHEKGMRINDPMDFFEELTRFKLLNGVLPLDTIYATEQLDVMAAAYTAWATDNIPEALTAIGDPKEGQIILPVRALKSKY